MIASLPMYDRPETAASNDRLWARIRTRLGFGPDHLTRGGDVWEHWRSADLVLSQTCGMPYRNQLHGEVSLVGTPDYGVGDQPGYYHSVFVARKSEDEDLPGYAERPFAYNEKGSQSGWAAPQCHAAALGFTFTNAAPSGGHFFSALAVAEGKADLASLDVVTWCLIRDMAEFSGLKAIAETQQTPGLPLITSTKQNAAAIFAAVKAAIGDLSDADRAILHLRDIVKIDADAYLAVPNPPV